MSFPGAQQSSWTFANEMSDITYMNATGSEGFPLFSKPSRLPLLIAYTDASKVDAAEELFIIRSVKNEG